MKLYTKSGDDGSTGLFGGERVRKDHPRVEAYGTVDELNAAIGLALTSTAGMSIADRFDAILIELQSRLFDLGADLATPPGSPHEEKTVRIAPADVAAVEAWIDEIDAGNTPMKSFILPGGSELAARLHIARTICRRGERVLVQLGDGETLSTPVLAFLNRVSDLLFAMAQRANHALGVDDVPWHPSAR